MGWKMNKILLINFPPKADQPRAETKNLWQKEMDTEKRKRNQRKLNR